MYTTRLYRAKILTALSTPLQEEILWLNAVALQHQKNYQIWHHRQFLLERIGSPKGEIAFINAMLAGDAKNYHVWSYRQWLVRRFGLWTSYQANGRADLPSDSSEDDDDDDADRQEAPPVETTELQETSLYIDADVRNNSAWNHRFFIVHASPGETSSAEIDRELEFAMAAVRKAPNNHSPWNYLRGTVEKVGKPLATLGTFCGEFVDLATEEVTSAPALGLLADIAIEEGRKEEAVKALDLLAGKYDPVRVGYWEYLKAGLEEGGSGAAARTITTGVSAGA